MKITVAVLSLLLFTAAPGQALAAEVIGHIQTLQGTASILRGDLLLPVAIGTELQCGDLIRTGSPGAAGLVLTDETAISLGPDSELSLNEYVFAPEEGKFSLVARMVRGTFVYLSGLIGKLAPNKVQLAIPDATISVRGTKLLIAVQP